MWLGQDELSTSLLLAAKSFKNSRLEVRYESSDHFCVISSSLYDLGSRSPWVKAAKTNDECPRRTPNVVLSMQWSLDIARTLFAENKGNGQWVIYALLLWLKDSWVYIRLSGFVAGSKYVCVWPQGYCWYVFCAFVGSLTYPNTVYNPYLAKNGIEGSGMAWAWFDWSINRSVLVPDLLGPFPINSVPSHPF